MEKQEPEEKKNSRIFGFWTKVTDLESAKDAASNAAIVSAYLAFSYALNIFFIIYSGKSLWSDAYGFGPLDIIEHNSLLIGYVLVTILCLFLIFRIYKKRKFGSVPFLALWMLLEIGMKSILVPGKGVVLSLIFFVLSINALIGWFGLKKYS